MPYKIFWDEYHHLHHCNHSLQHGEEHSYPLSLSNSKYDTLPSNVSTKWLITYRLKTLIITSNLSNDRSKTSSKTIPPHSAI